MQYLDQIDDILLQVLLEAEASGKSLGYNKLYNALNEDSRMKPYFAAKGGKPELSKSIFFEHRKKLLTKGLINKKDSDEPRTVVPHYVTMKGKKEFRLGILGGGQRQQFLRELYINLLFQGIFLPRAHPIKDLDGFLSKIKTNKRQLVLENIDNEMDHYYPDEIDRMKEQKTYNTSMTVYYKEIAQITIIKRVQFRTTRGVKNKINEEYRYFPPGVSIKEYLEGRFFDGEISRQDLENAFQLLHQVALISPLMFEGELRYVLADNIVAELMKDLHRLCDFQQYILQYRWMFIKGPTLEEKERALLYYGHEEAKQVIRMCEQVYNERLTSLSGEAKRLGIPRRRVAYAENVEQFDMFRSQFLEGLEQFRKKYGSKILAKEDYALIREVIQRTCPRILQNGK